MSDKSGNGIKSLRTSTAFRILNFELYTRPNKIIMTFGFFCFVTSFGYIFYMRQKYQNMGYYAVTTDTGNEVYVKKKSKWET
ncbi:hypothetical protein PGB90_000089 [Kerria lacca]